MNMAQENQRQSTFWQRESIFKGLPQGIIWNIPETERPVYNCCLLWENSWLFQGGLLPRAQSLLKHLHPRSLGPLHGPCSVPCEATSGCLLCLWKARPKPPTQELISGILTHLQLLLHSGPLSPFIWKFHMVPPAQSCASLHLKWLTEVSLNQFC